MKGKGNPNDDCNDVISARNAPVVISLKFSRRRRRRIKGTGPRYAALNFYVCVCIPGAKREAVGVSGGINN